MKKQLEIGIAITLVAFAAVIVMMAKSGSYDDAKGSHSTNSGTAAIKESAIAEPNTVTVSSYKFGPNKVTVKKGTKVTWINQDEDRHNIQPDQENSGFKPSPLLAKDEQYSFVFDNAGTYKYHCSPHPYMKAIVEVTE